MQFVWQWPQITWAILTALGLLISVAKDGEPKTGKHSVGVRLVEVLLGGALLFFGGFFTEVRP